MTTYISPPTETDPDQLSQDAIDYLSTNIPGWEGADGNLETWHIYALARMVAELKDTESAVPLSIFRYFGGNLAGVTPIDAVAATVTTTWTVKDNAGYTIPEGTQVGYPAAGDDLVPFVTQADVVIPPGSVATAAGAVVLIAVDPGTAANGLPAGNMTLLDPLAYVTSVVSTAASAGGVDAEDDDTYLARLVDELALLTPRPIFAQDFAVLARARPGIHRAVGVDNYNPADNTSTNERMVAVALVDVAGNAVTAGEKADVQAYLDAMREINFIVNIFDPVWTNIDVTFQFTVSPGADPGQVQTDAEATVTAFLEPYNWGTDFDDVALVTWTNETVVRYNDLIARLYTVSGLRSVPLLQIMGVAADYQMPGKVALPRPGVIDGTVA
jgi:hypothetical protein